MTRLGERWLASADWPIQALQEYGLSVRQCAQAMETMRHVCRDAWTTGLLRGFNGNMSLRLTTAAGQHVLLVTGTGSAKGHLRPEELALADMQGQLLLGQSLSSETPMHVEVYAARADVSCVLHVHPARMLALSLRLDGQWERFLNMPLLESALWKNSLGRAGFFPNGSRELARAVGRAFAQEGIRAVFMEGHGLCAAGATAWEALGICEQLEHMAAAQLWAGC